MVYSRTIKSVFEDIVSHPPQVDGVELWNTQDGITAFNQLYDDTQHRLTFLVRTECGFGMK